MSVGIFSADALNDVIERRQEAPVSTLRYEGHKLEGFVTPRWNAKKRMKVKCIDFNRDGAGLILDVPAWEQGDDVCLYIRAIDKPELKLHAMPASVRYRINWEGGFRIGLQFMPSKSLFREENIRLQACALETYLAEVAGYDNVAIIDGITRDKILSANDPSS